MTLAAGYDNQPLTVPIRRMSSWFTEWKCFGA